MAFPDELTNEDMKTSLKEWRLAGYDVWYSYVDSLVWFQEEGIYYSWKGITGPWVKKTYTGESIAAIDAKRWKG